jgi:AcrR family transcriptional regulator
MCDAARVTSSSTGLRERKKVATRRALAAAALRLAAERGAELVTAEDIAAAADVSVRTFFNYFPTKEAAFVADDLARGRAFVAAVAAAPDGVPVWGLLRQSALDTLIVSELPDREQALKEQLVRTSPLVIAEVLGTFTRLEQHLVGELDRRLSESSPLMPRLMANAVAGVVRAATETWLGSDAADPAEFIRLLDDGFAVLEPAFADAAASAPLG